MPAQIYLSEFARPDLFPQLEVVNTVGVTLALLVRRSHHGVLEPWYRFLQRIVGAVAALVEDGGLGHLLDARSFEQRVNFADLRRHILYEFKTMPLIGVLLLFPLVRLYLLIFEAVRRKEVVFFTISQVFFLILRRNLWMSLSWERVLLLPSLEGSMLLRCGLDWVLFRFELRLASGCIGNCRIWTVFVVVGDVGDFGQKILDRGREIADNLRLSDAAVGSSLS